MAVALNSHRTGTWVNMGTLASAPLAGGAPREVLENVQWADWSPDGSNLAVVRDVGGRNRLEYPIGKVLYETGGWISHPRISPKGDMVAFLDHPFRATTGARWPSLTSRATRKNFPQTGTAFRVWPGQLTGRSLVHGHGNRSGS